MDLGIIQTLALVKLETPKMKGKGTVQLKNPDASSGSTSHKTRVVVASARREPQREKYVKRKKKGVERGLCIKR